MAKGSKKSKAAKASKVPETPPEKDNRGNEEIEKKDKKGQNPPRKFIPRFDDPHKIRIPFVDENLTSFQKIFYCRECKIRYSNTVKPTSMICGHSICDMCIEERMGKQYTCKKCLSTNEIAIGKFKTNYLLMNIIDDIMDDVYLRCKIFDSFNARGTKIPPEAAKEECVDPLILMSAKAIRKTEELEACKKLITEEVNTDKAQKKIINATESSFATLKENLLGVDLSSIVSAVSDLHTSMKPVEIKLAEYRQNMGRICSLDEGRRKFLRRLQVPGVELQFDQKIVKELHDNGYKMIVAFSKKSNSLFARLEWHEFGIHLNCFNATKPEDVTFFFEYNDIVNSECDGISHVWFDVAAPFPKVFKDKDPSKLCSFDFAKARKDAILVEEEVRVPREVAAPTESTVDTSGSDPKAVTDQTPEFKKIIVKKSLPSYRQRVYIGLAETCYASHFAEFALGKDKVSYKDWNLKLEKSDGFVVSVGNDGRPPSLKCQYTSIHPYQYLFPQERGNIYANSSDMKSGAFKIALNSAKEESSLIGTICSGMDFFDKIETYASIKDCGVVLKFKKEEKK